MTAYVAYKVSTRVRGIESTFEMSSINFTVDHKPVCIKSFIDHDIVSAIHRLASPVVLGHV